MLTMSYVNAKGMHCSQQWEIGDNRAPVAALIVLGGVDIHDLQSITVSGVELEHILMNFHNIPRTRTDHEFVTYFGEMAKFFVANWMNN
jgi:hypothetical protein